MEQLSDKEREEQRKLISRPLPDEYRKRSGHSEYFPFAIVLHAITDVPAAFCGKGDISIAVPEAAELVYALMILYLAIRMYRGIETEGKEN